MSKPKDQALYDSIKTKLYNEMPKHSAYRSGILVKRYKQEYFKKHKNKNAYVGKKTNKGLTRWFKEDWRTEKGKKTYKEGGTIFRPTKRITKDTPTTMSELTSKEKEKAIQEKKTTGRVKKYKNINNDNMKVVFKKSTNMKKKLMALFFEKDEDEKYKKIKTTHFGSAGMSDYTIHHDKDRRKRYLDRHEKNENWSDPMSAGSLSKHILWGNNTSKKANIRAFKNKFNFV